MSESFEFVLFIPTKENAEIVYSWRNDPEVLANSIHSEPQLFEKFYEELPFKYFNYPKLPSVFIQIGGEKIGLLRFNPVETAVFQDSTEISILIAKSFRNKGWASAILLAIEPFLITQGIKTIVARIKTHNEASIKAFAKAKYIYNDQEDSLLRYVKTLLLSRPLTPFVIAEAGSNWMISSSMSQNLDCAFKMIAEAKNAGADAVKFQTFQADKTYAPNSGFSKYLMEQGINKEIKAVFKELEMPPEMIAKLAKECERQNIEFMSSVFSTEDFKLVDPYVKRHKIASYEITFAGLIEAVACSKKPLILSTGASTLDDIDWAVKYFYEKGGEDLTLLQCTAKYPSPIEELHLGVISSYRDRYQCTVGLSDHSTSLEAPLIAIALGGTVIEKHFTLNRNLEGPDHRFALEPFELKQMIHAIRQVNPMIGSSLKQVFPIEEELYYFAHRGIQALRDIQPGEILMEGLNIAILRPGERKLGIHPKYLTEISGNKVKRAILEGNGIQWEDFNDN